MAGSKYRIFLHSGRPRKKLWTLHYWWTVERKRNGEIVLASEPIKRKVDRDQSVREYLSEANHDVYDADSGTPVILTSPRSAY